MRTVNDSLTGPANHVASSSTTTSRNERTVMSVTHQRHHLDKTTRTGKEGNPRNRVITAVRRITRIVITGFVPGNASGYGGRSRRGTMGILCGAVGSKSGTLVPGRK